MLVWPACGSARRAQLQNKRACPDGGLAPLLPPCATPATLPINLHTHLVCEEGPRVQAHPAADALDGGGADLLGTVPGAAKGQGRGYENVELKVPLVVRRC